jgi:penicillin-binding protein 2A
MTSMLLNVVETGTGKGAHIPGVEIAAKTGSTQLSFTDNGTKDEWMVGYTTDLAGAVWMGYDQTDQQHYLTSSTSAGVVPLFKAVMQSGLPYTKHPNFEVQSVNAQLAQKNQTEQMLQNQAAKIGKELSDNAKKLTQTIENQAPAWKQHINQALHSLGSTVNSLVEKLQGLGGR